MFRTLNVRGKSRSKFFQEFTGNKKAKLNLSSAQIKLIETSSFITLAEKIELFLVALGNKLTTELYMKIQFDEEQEKEIFRKLDSEKIAELLSQLPFSYYQDYLPLKNRQNGKVQDFTWFQVSVNDAVSTFMKKYPDDLTEFEEGILYGFPLSAIQAFTGLIEPSHDKPTPASSFLAGVCSKDFWEDEQEYYQKWWERLRLLSPKIVKEAEEQFKRL